MKRVLLYTILILGAVMFTYPFLWMVSATFAPEQEISKLLLLPSRFVWTSYQQVFAKIPILRALLNSLFVASAITLSVIVLASMVGYALSRYRFKGQNLLFYVIIFTMTLPFQITLIPQYIMMVKFGWVDSYLALIVPYMMNAFAIILFRQHFMTIPQDLIDAARIDGCGELRILFRILMPNSIPAVVTVGIITFMTAWNEVLWPLIVIRDQEMMTMPQLVALFVVGGRAESQLGVKLAAATLLAIPIVLAYFFFQRYFIRSMASSGLKE